MSAPLIPGVDGCDDYVVQQENELEALASIFGEDFQDVRTKHPWKVQRHRRHAGRVAFNFFASFYFVLNAVTECNKSLAVAFIQNDLQHS